MIAPIAARALACGKLEFIRNRDRRTAPDVPGRARGTVEDRQEHQTLKYGPAEFVSLALAVLLVGVAAALGWRAWKAGRITPEERERLRRADLAAYGKMGDATLVDYRGNNLFYSYLVRGVEYTASQEVSSLQDRLPVDLSAGGPVSVKL